MSDALGLQPQHPMDTRLPGLLRSGRVLRGIFNGIPSPAIVEMCAYAGFDFIVIDNEHGSADYGMTEHMLRAARAAGMAAVVRCFEPDIPRVLDMGAAGVQVPMVSSAAQAARLVSKVRYPQPDGSGGRRGSAFSTRAAGYGAFGGPAHTRRSNEGIALVVMIETPEGVANAAEIAAVAGVDAVFVGPNDLSHAMGCENRWHEPPVQAAIAQVLRSTAAAGICPGVLALSPEDEARYVALGARYLATVSTSLITQALRAAAQGARPSLSY